MSSREQGSRRAGIVRAPQDACAGLFLIALAVFALWQGADLAVGTMRQVGPGMLPRSLAVITGIAGIAMMVGSCLAEGSPLDRWTVRGPLFILGAAVAFGLGVRPLGLAVVGPAAIIIAAQASPETRWLEAVIFGVVITTFCLLLFKVALGLPIPVAPWLIGY